MEHGEKGNPAAGGSTHPLRLALDDISGRNNEFRVETGLLEPGWITAEAFFRDTTTIDAFLDFEATYHPGMEPKTRAALMMLDYCYVLMLATIPLAIGHGIVPDMAPARMAFQFFDTLHEHDSESHTVRRAHVRFLSRRFSNTGPDDARSGNHEQLCETFRQEIEAHCKPLIEVLFARTGLARAALWRLAGDAITGRCLETGRQLRCLEKAKAIGMGIVKQPGSPLNNRQVRYLELTLHDDDGAPVGAWSFRMRGGCCRFYTVAGGALCSTCVLKDRGEQEAELLQTMRDHVDRLKANT